MKTIHVAIGNSDDKLTQDQWAQFYGSVDRIIDRYATQVHGRWASLPTAPFQNACWAFTLATRLPPDDELKNRLRTLAAAFDQDSIAWNESEPQFLEAR